MRVVWGMFLGVYLGAALFGVLAAWALLREFPLHLGLSGGVLLVACPAVFGLVAHLRRPPAKDHHAGTRVVLGLFTAWALASVLMGVSFGGVLIFEGLQEELGQSVSLGALIESWAEVMGVLGVCGIVMGFVLGYRAR